MTKSQRISKRKAAATSLAAHSSSNRPGDDAPGPSDVASQPQSPLLHLPAELRNKIYRYTLVSDHHLTLNHLNQPPLTATCRQIEAEAVPIFFSTNKFILKIRKESQKPLINPFTISWVRAAEVHTHHILNVKIRQTHIWPAYDIDIIRAEESKVVVMSPHSFNSYMRDKWEVVTSEIEAYLDRAVGEKDSGLGLATKGLCIKDVIKVARILLQRI